MKRLSSICVAGIIVIAAPAGAEIYRRVDQAGNVTWTNLPPRAAEETAPAPKAVQPSAQRAEPVAVLRVTREEQRSRDTDSRAILEEELEKERAAQASAEARKDEQAAARHLANVEAIRREIGRLK